MDVVGAAVEVSSNKEKRDVKKEELGVVGTAVVVVSSFYVFIYLFLFGSAPEKLRKQK